MVGAGLVGLALLVAYVWGRIVGSRKDVYHDREFKEGLDDRHVSPRAHLAAIREAERILGRQRDDS